MITQEKLKSLVVYERDASSFCSIAVHGSWNTKYAGKIVGYINSMGRPAAKIDGKCHNISRLIWIYCNGVPDLGLYKNPEHAAHAYNKAAVKLHGDFAVLNPFGDKS